MLKVGNIVKVKDTNSVQKNIKTNNRENILNEEAVIIDCFLSPITMVYTMSLLSNDNEYRVLEREVDFLVEGGRHWLPINENSNNNPPSISMTTMPITH